MNLFFSRRFFLGKKFSNVNYSRFVFVFGAIFWGLVNPTLAQPYKCTPAQVIQPPPLPNDAPLAKASLKPVCPTGQVPQPLITKINKNKGLPPISSFSIAPGYHYVYGYQYITAVGASGNFTQHKPFLSSSDKHSLVELAGQSSDGKQIVEVGWTVDKGLNGDNEPHLFVFSWVNRIPNCYNGCGYVQYSPTIFPGMTIADDGSSHYQAVEYYYGDWWLNYDGQWIGYFPSSMWSNQGVSFQQLGLVQWFGEVDSGGGLNTQMGNGIFGASGNSASISNTTIFTSANKLAASWVLGQTDPACYNYGVVQLGNTFRYGGPGC